MPLLRSAATPGPSYVIVPTEDPSPSVKEKERYTAFDAAEFSRQGACMVAVPTGEPYQLPRIKDMPPPTESRKAIELGAGEQDNGCTNSGTPGYFYCGVQGLIVGVNLME
jgi:hypothetical protein